MAAKWLADLLGGQATSIITGIGDTAKKFITTDQDRMAFELEQQKWEFEFKKLAMTAEEKYFEDRNSARDMYKTDNKLQKIFAMTFLVGYILLTVVMIYLVVAWIGAKGIEIPDWAVALISTIYGAMSSKVNTITDFLFGSSQGSSDKNEIIKAAKKDAPSIGDS